MSNNKNLESKMNFLEEKVNQLFSILNPRTETNIDRDKFAKFYNIVKYDMPIKSGFTPLCIWINQRYAEDMQKNMLYPSEFENYWYLTGEVSPVPIGFKETINNEDYYVDFRTAGNFI